MVENHEHWENVYNGSFSWKKNAEDIPVDPRYETAGNTLIINNLVMNDEGNIIMEGFYMMDKMLRHIPHQSIIVILYLFI